MKQEASQNLDANEVRIRKNASILVLIVSVVLLLIKFWAHNLTGSQAVFSDALESIVNVVAAALGMFVMFYSAKPRDEDHPYGHGKVEYFSSAFEGGLIAFAAMLIVFESVKAFFNDDPLARLDLGLLMISITAIVNAAVGFYLIILGKRLRSVALGGSGQHLVSDFITTIGVVLGLVLVQLTGLKWIDSLTALLIGLQLAWTGLKLVRQSVGALMDAEDPQILHELVNIFKKTVFPGIIQIHDVRVIRSGWYHHIDAHIVVPEFWEVSEAHEKTNKFEHQIFANYKFQGDINFHLDPCRQAYCQHCDLEDCPVRKQNFVSRMPVRLTDIRSPVEPTK